VLSRVLRAYPDLGFSDVIAWVKSHVHSGTAEYRQMAKV
jgi:hypothetical protein